MNKLFFFTIILIFINSLSVIADNTILPSHSKWELTFSDEFNDSKLDLTKWFVYNSKMNRKYMIGRYSANVKLENGILKLITRQPDKKRLKFTTGFIKSKNFTQKYGYFAARIRYAKVSGLNNAFWLVTEKLPKEKSFEIDINEGHYPNEIVSTIHTWSSNEKIKSITSKYYPQKTDLYRDFHVYACEWTPEKINIYLDYKKIYEGKNTKCNSAVPVLFSTAVTLFSGKVTGKLDGSSMDIDWVRIYKRIPSAPKINNSQLKITKDRSLTWNNAVDNITPPQKILYKIYLSNKNSSMNQPGGLILGETIGINHFDLSCIPNNKKYHINVFAFDEAGDYTSYVSRTVYFVNKNRNVPKPGQMGKINITATSWNKVNMDWSPASYSSCPGSKLKYLVYLSMRNDIDTPELAFKNGQLKTILKGKTSCTIENLYPGEKLWFNVIAVSTDGSRNSYQMASIKMPVNTSPPFAEYTFTNPENPGEDSANKFNATNHGVKLVRDMERYSTVAEFDGKKAFMSIPPLNMNSNHVTISAWLKIPAKQKAYSGIIFSRRETAGLWFGSSASLGYRWPGGCPYNWQTSLKPPVNQWFQIILVISPDKATVYMRKNGKLYFDDYTNASQQKSALNFCEIGRDSHKIKGQIIRYFKGFMDDIKIYNRAMSFNEVQKLK